MTRELSNAQIRKLKGLAQRLDPVVHVGRRGVTAGLTESVAQALADHELVKVRFHEFKETKRTLTLQIAEATSSHLVTVIGNVAVFYRPNPVSKSTG
jgi:RNA-binding protein